MGGGCFVEVALLLFWVVVVGVFGGVLFCVVGFPGGLDHVESKNGWRILNNTCAQKVKQSQLHYTEGEPDAMPLH